MAPEEKNEETAETSGKGGKPKAKWGLTLLLLLGFLAGNSIGYISEYTGRKLSEATSKDAA